MKTHLRRSEDWGKPSAVCGVYSPPSCTMVLGEVTCAKCQRSTTMRVRRETERCAKRMGKAVK